MEEFNELDIQIIRFLEGEMESEELLIFEQRIQTDAQVKLKLEEYQLILKGVEKWGDKLLQDYIKNTENNLNKSGFFEERTSYLKNHKLNSFPYFQIAAAAAVMAVLVVYAIFLPIKPKVDKQKLFANYYKIDTAFVELQMQKIEESGFIPTSSSKDSFSLALQQYIKKEYKNSLALLLHLPNEEQAKDVCQFFIGLNQLGLQNYKEAESIFTSLCNSSEYPERIDACWNLLLCNIKQNADSKKIVELLQILLNSNKQNQAREILKAYQ